MSDSHNLKWFLIGAGTWYIVERQIDGIERRAGLRINNVANRRKFKEQFNKDTEKFRKDLERIIMGKKDQDETTIHVSTEEGTHDRREDYRTESEPTTHVDVAGGQGNTTVSVDKDQDDS